MHRPKEREMVFAVRRKEKGVLGTLTGPQKSRPLKEGMIIPVAGRWEMLISAQPGLTSPTRERPKS